MRPFAMMMARVHTSWTSSKMWVETITSLSLLSSLISRRTSCF